MRFRILIITFLSYSLIIMLLSCNSKSGYHQERWSEEEANQWYDEVGWKSGANFVPSTAINQLEMWQADTFDPKSIERELGWAKDLGFNAMRVYLHNLVWENDPEGFKDRINKYLEIADSRGIATIFVFFDDCWNDDPKSGKQPEPITGVHNSGWIQGPGSVIVNDSTQWYNLELYVKDILKSFGSDKRVLLWDLYNEPGNTGQLNKSLPLLKSVFRWAREEGASQPISVAVWNYSEEFDSLNSFSLSNSDVITFHQYSNVEDVKQIVKDLRKYNRPLICTEYMARTNNSKFETHFPYFRSKNISCINWGLVSGRSQTIYPWGSKEGSPEPEIWFHDIFRSDGTPFDSGEIKIIKNINEIKK